MTNDQEPINITYMIQFYKPNAKVTGTACSFYMNQQDGSFFSTLIKQASWDEKRRIGKFDKNKKAIIKLSQLEVASLMNAIDSKVEFKGYHKSSQQVVQFSLAPSTKVDGAFTYSVTREASDDSTNKTSFFLGLYANEAVLLREHLQYLLHESFRLSDLKFSAPDTPKSKPETESAEEDDMAL